MKDHTLSSPNIRRADPRDQPLLEQVDDGLGRFNNSVAPLHEVEPLACVAEDPAGQFLGGVVGRTWGACAEIQQLWVADSSRHQGTGRALMTAFEDAARKRGVKTFYLETWSFQARGFYEKLGYAVALEISGMGAGLAKYTMIKKLH